MRESLEMRHTNSFDWEDGTERGSLQSIFSVIVISARLPIVNTSQGSLQPKASEVMRNVDLILSSSPHYSWESRQGVKKRNLCFSHSAANKRVGIGKSTHTHTPPAINSLEFVFSAQNPQRPGKREETSRLGGMCCEGIRETCENEDICHRILFTGCWRTVTLHPVQEQLWRIW